MRRVVIAGVGLIGGSFALALRKAGFDGEIAGISSPATIQAAMSANVIDAPTTLEEAARCADLIYLAQPIDQILKTLEILGPLAHPGCLITDAGSTKSLIEAKAHEYVHLAAFLGGHPMSGKEQRGVAHADADLFRGRPYVLTPVSRANPHIDEFRAWLKKIGCQIVDMTPEQHDRTVALTSHLPQLLSTTLAATLAGSDEEAITRIFGPGLVDMTRLAMSGAELWTGILQTNGDAVLEALKLFQNTLAETISALRCDDIGRVFEQGAGFARRIRGIN